MSCEVTVVEWSVVEASSTPLPAVSQQYAPKERQELQAQVHRVVHLTDSLFPYRKVTTAAGGLIN